MPFDPDLPPDGLRLLRRYHEATVQFHERRAEVRFIVDAASGAIVFPAEPGFVSATELVIHLPDEVTRHLQLAIEPAAIARPEAEECVDRWHAYHAAARTGSGGERTAWAWLRCEITGAKRPDAPGDVYDREALMRPNPLRKAEPRLVKHVNTSRDRLGWLARRHARVEVSDPLCVGVDPHGLDIRARFGIVRVEFDLEAGSPEQAQALIDAMLSKAA
ncbi:MAG: hypothetical protein IT438_11735 [Phycisphaerales bacterium]|nr:hypothetical protein [Phycisphaerales bacterium]